MAIFSSMAVTTIKSTYSLDAESVRILEDLARRWEVSKSEVLRRAIRGAAATLSPGDTPALEALGRLQASVHERNVDIELWERERGAERKAAVRLG